MEPISCRIIHSVWGEGIEGICGTLEYKDPEGKTAVKFQAVSDRNGYINWFKSPFPVDMIPYSWVTLTFISNPTFPVAWAVIGMDFDLPPELLHEFRVFLQPIIGSFNIKHFPKTPEGSRVLEQWDSLLPEHRLGEPLTPFQLPPPIIEYWSKPTGLANQEEDQNFNGS